MIRNLFIAIALILLGGAGYFAYDKWIKDTDLSPWSFVPGNALFIYENDDLGTTLNSLEQTQAWKALTLIRGFRAPKETLGYLDSLLNVEGKSRQLLSKVPFTVSGHLTSKNSFGLLYVFAIKNLELHTSINSILTSFEEAGYDRKVRRYLDFSITELSYRGEIRFTFIFHKNYFIGSKTAYLVEDAIRVFSDPENQGFYEINPELFDLVKIKKDQGNLYFNMARLQDFLQAFTDSSVPMEFAKSAYFDIDVNDGEIQMDGFTYPDQKGLLKTLQNVDGSLFDLSEIVSNDIAVFHHFSFRSSSRFRDQIKNELSPDIRMNKQLLISDYDFDPDYVFDLTDEELAVGVRYERDQLYKSFYIKSKNPADAISFFTSVAERYERTLGESLKSETYGDYTIIKLGTPEFPATLLGNLANGFAECYLTSYRNYLIFANSLPGLKKILDDIASENTWRKSLRKVNFLEKTNPEANYSLFLNTPNAWNHLLKNSDSKWSSILLQNDFIIKQFDNIALQFNQIDNKFFTNIVIDIPDASALGDKNPTEKSSISLASPISTKPYLVRQAGTADFEVLVQDTTHRLYKIGADFDVGWDIEIGEAIVDKIQEVDYYANGTQQYLFITFSELHLIENTGEYVPGYPVSFEDAGVLRKLGVIDYDGSKRYRFSISDSKGQVYLTDKNGRALEGWNPRYYPDELTHPLRHYRVGNRDVMLSQTTSGEIHMTNRRGEFFPGFPVKLDQQVSNAFHFTMGSQFSSTRLTTLTTNGELISLDLKSAIRNREELFKPTADVEFFLVNAVSGKSFIILRKYGNQYDILDENGELLFSKDYLQEEDFFIQYYDLSPSRQYIVVGNLQDEFIYVYDINGDLITNRPLKGSNPVSMMYSGSRDEHQIYLTYQNQLMLIQLN